MNETETSSYFQKIIETIEELPPDDRQLLIEIVRNHLIQQRRAEMASDIAEARSAYQCGTVKRGAVSDLMEDLSE